jgi:hypothetical protein
MKVLRFPVYERGREAERNANSVHAVQFIILYVIKKQLHAHTRRTICIHTNFPATYFDGRPPSSGSNIWNLCSVQPRETIVCVITAVSENYMVIQD